PFSRRAACSTRESPPRRPLRLDVRSTANPLSNCRPPASTAPRHPQGRAWRSVALETNPRLTPTHRRAEVQSESRGLRQTRASPCCRRPGDRLEACRLQPGALCEAERHPIHLERRQASLERSAEPFWTLPIPMRLPARLAFRRPTKVRSTRVD